MVPKVDDIRHSKWATRAWTYQETLLSKRRLYFTEYQLYFESSYCVRCEWKDAIATDRHWIDSQGAWFSKPSDIYKCIESYTERSLTFQSDALNAILGILAVYEHKFQVHHLWGMPYMKTGSDSPLDPTMTRSLFFEASKQSVRCTKFPSWSWAGWTGRKDWSLVLEMMWSSTPQLCVAVELTTGLTMTWEELHTSDEVYKRHTDKLSPFIHIQGHLIPIIGVKQDDRDEEHMVTDVTMQLADEVTFGYCEFDWEPSILDHISGVSIDEFLVLRPLLGATPEYSADVPHLLIRNIGDHWERITNVSCLAKYKDRDGKTIDREFWPGTLQTIRMG